MGACFPIGVFVCVGEGYVCEFVCVSVRVCACVRACWDGHVYVHS